MGYHTDGNIYVEVCEEVKGSLEMGCFQNMKPFKPEVGGNRFFWNITNFNHTAWYHIPNDSIFHSIALLLCGCFDSVAFGIDLCNFGGRYLSVTENLNSSLDSPYGMCQKGMKKFKKSM